jgi:hypothetical protein
MPPLARGIRSSSVALLNPALKRAHNGAVDNSLLFEARALVLADLEARHQANAVAVSALEDACASRQWWAEQWPEGAAYVAGLVAQDVQDALFEKVGRWPMCLECDDGPAHSLYIQPDLGGPDPVWVCEETGEIAAPLGFLGSGRG